MKKAAVIIYSLFCLLKTTEGQQSYFVYIQSEASQPFYVLLDDRTYSSSPIGHLVISGLKDSTYSFSIGFPRNQFPEQDYAVPVNKRDRGFELRQRDNKWVMFDWQSSESIQPLSKEERKAGTISESKRSDPYALLMAGVVNDSAVLYETLAVAPQPKQEKVVSREEAKTPETSIVAIEPESKQKDSTTSIAVSNTISDTTTTAKNDIAEIDKTSKAQPAIALLKERNLSDGKQMTYIDPAKPADTITIVIPYEAADSSQLIAQAPVESQKSDTGNSVSQNADTGSLKGDSVQQTVSTDSASTDSRSSIVLMNSDCRQFATDNDLDKLRVSMLRENTDDEKVVLARRIFRSKCFTTKQVRALTELFSGDEGKYQLFDAAYPFVSDSGNFKSLVNLLQDTYYINRFKAMVRM